MNSTATSKFTRTKLQNKPSFLMHSEQEVMGVFFYTLTCRYFLKRSLSLFNKLQFCNICVPCTAYNRYFNISRIVYGMQTKVNTAFTGILMLKGNHQYTDAFLRRCHSCIFSFKVVFPLFFLTQESFLFSFLSTRIVF